MSYILPDKKFSSKALNKSETILNTAINAWQRVVQDKIQLLKHFIRLVFCSGPHISQVQNKNKKVIYDTIS